MNIWNLPEIKITVSKNNTEETDIKLTFPLHLCQDINDYHEEELAKECWWTLYKKIREEFKKYENVL